MQPDASMRPAGHTRRSWLRAVCAGRCCASAAASWSRRSFERKPRAARACRSCSPARSRWSSLPLLPPVRRVCRSSPAPASSSTVQEVFIGVGHRVCAAAGVRGADPRRPELANHGPGLRLHFDPQHGAETRRRSGSCSRYSARSPTSRSTGTSRSSRPWSRASDPADRRRAGRRSRRCRRWRTGARSCSRRAAHRAAGRDRAADRQSGLRRRQPRGAAAQSVRGRLDDHAGVRFLVLIWLGLPHGADPTLIDVRSAPVLRMLGGSRTGRSSAMAENEQRTAPKSPTATAPARRRASTARCRARAT